MQSGFKIGKIFGITIYIDPSWLLIFVLVTWNLAAGVFPALHPNWGLGLTLLVSVVAALLFFASVLAHELAHSLVARARGIPVRNITLFLFGGVSNIQREPPSPGTEFFMAIVGPLTSIVLGILFVGIASLLAGNVSLLTQNPTQVLAQLDPVASLLLWLGPINIILGIFNLIPGFPLDGGRVLRSILWAITHNLRQATRWAAWVGQAIGWLFILAGIAMIFGLELPILGGGFLSGVWLAFIGWFLNNAAAQSYQQVVIRNLLEGVPVSRLMRAQIPTVPPNLAISELVDNYIMRTDQRAFPVVTGDQLLGLVCLEDVRKVPRGDWDKTRVSEIMTPAAQLEQVKPQEDASVAFDKLSERDVQQVPVVQDGHLVGLLRSRDIVKWLQLHEMGAE